MKGATEKGGRWTPESQTPNGTHVEHGRASRGAVGTGSKGPQCS